MTQLKHDHVWRDMIPKHRIPLYTIVSGNDIGQGVLQKTYKHVVRFFEEHVSGSTNTIHALFAYCVTFNKYITNINILFENSVTYNKRDYNNIYMLFKN